MIKKAVFFVIACICSLHSFSQIYVNREFQNSSGEPVFNPLFPFGQHWSQSITGANGELITVSHTDTTAAGDEDVFLSRITVDGQVVYTVSLNSAGTNNDYGVSLTEDPTNGDTYVVGVTDNGVTNDYDVLVLKYDITGSLQNTYTYAGSSGMNDLAAAIRINPVSNNIIVAIASEDISSGYDYVVLELDHSLSYINEQRYDYAAAGLPDVPVGLDFDGGGNIMLIGASASSAVDWDYCVVAFDVSTLAFIVDDRVAASGFGYDQPLAFCLDAAKNIYITGRASTDGTNYDIRTVKISSSLTSIIWDQTYDGSATLEDAGNSIALDANGDVIVGGFSTNSSGKKEMIWRKYDGSTGSPIWTNFQSAEDPNGDAFVKTLAVSSVNDEIYFVASEKGNSGFIQSLVGKIKNNGEKNWQKTISDPSADILPSDLELSGTDVYVISVLDAVDNSYLTTKYSEFELDTARVFAGNNNPAWKKNELIVRFVSTALDPLAIDNQVGTAIKAFGTLEYFMDPTAYALTIAALETACGECNDIKAVKIFDGFPTTFTDATSHLGETVPISDFWTALLLQFPNGTSIEQAYHAFETIPTIVVYSHPNFLVKPHTAPDDTLYSKQFSLKKNNTFPNSDINMQAAWDLFPDGGRQHIRVGIFDTGLSWKHEDLRFGFGSNAPSRMVAGWNFQTNSDLKLLNNGGDVYATISGTVCHGTAVAGIIGAARDNLKFGIAGIAGWNYGNGSHGLSLYGLRTLYNIGGTSTIADMASAMLFSAFSPANSVAKPYSYDLNLQNHSWGGGYNPNLWYADTSFSLISDAMHQLNRLKVTLVASRGNLGNNSVQYPATVDDDWVISVSGSGTDGQFIHHTGWPSGSPNGEFTSDWGRDVDVAAPSSTALVISTHVDSDTTYRRFNGTSAAAPHVSGVVGSLMSYFNDTIKGPNNLAPEDCEWIIQLSATDVDSTNYDQLSGHGRLNAGQAMTIIQRPFYKLWHFSTASPHSYSLNRTLISSVDTVKMLEPFQHPGINTWYHKGKYIVNTYKVTSTFNHPFSNKDTIIASWPRSSSTGTWDLLKNKIITPRQRCKITSINHSTAQLEGYIYQVKDSLGSSIGWWPFDNTYSGGGGPGDVFAYSVLTRNLNFDVGVEEKLKDGLAVQVYPNPTNGNQNIAIETDKVCDLTIDLYDVMGRKLKTVYSGKSQPSKTTIQHDVSNLPNNLYIYNIYIDGKLTNQKFIKQ